MCHNINIYHPTTLHNIIQLKIKSKQKYNTAQVNNNNKKHHIIVPYTKGLS